MSEQPPAIHLEPHGDSGGLCRCQPYFRFGFPASENIPNSIFCRYSFEIMTYVVSLVCMALVIMHIRR
jgi:hypothetical protein